jgi:hypothetical protein
MAENDMGHYRAAIASFDQTLTLNPGSAGLTITRE